MCCMHDGLLVLSLYFHRVSRSLFDNECPQGEDIWTPHSLVDHIGISLRDTSQRLEGMRQGKWARAKASPNLPWHFPWPWEASRLVVPPVVVRQWIPQGFLIRPPPHEPFNGSWRPRWLVGVAVDLPWILESFYGGS